MIAAYLLAFAGLACAYAEGAKHYPTSKPFWAVVLLLAAWPLSIPFFLLLRWVRS